ncbi:MAG: hypothetical protein FWH27_13905 [Planctomycetaceae bacterium]|nr:hypothetical protein [Planctomycetaceae bacterium]
MNFNFFDWIRDGVRRSVLLGVSDAVETMGMPHDEETSRSKILHFLQTEDGNQEASSRRRITNTGGSASGSRKSPLGRGLADVK